MGSRLVNDEVKHGHPGFPFHQATTEDLTQSTERFVLRPVACSCGSPGRRTGRWCCYVVTYQAPAITAPVLNARHNRLTRWIERTFYR
jgi:hypothetical protein